MEFIEIEQLAGCYGFRREDSSEEESVDAVPYSDEQ
jgi:hypothetical protein